MKVLVVEDEPTAARRLVKMIEEAGGDEVQIVGQLDSISSTIDWWNQHPKPDLLFMDIQLADGNSFEIFKQIEVKQPIIFTTAYDQYALQAFQVNAIDYLLKPIKKQELKNAIDKYIKSNAPAQFDFTQLADILAAEKVQKRFMIRIGQQIKVVDLKEVAYFYSKDKITFLITKDGKRYPIDDSLEKLEELLRSFTQYPFFRINRQFIVGISAIDEMYSYSKSRVKLSLNPKCELETIVSTERSPVFKKWLVGED